MKEFFLEITSDGWISFAGSLLGALLTLISILIAWKIGKKQILQQERERKKVYYDQLLSSLPSIDMLQTQADYLNDEDNLLGGFSDAESRTKIMLDRMNSSSCSREECEHYKHKIKCHEKYLTYWKAANDKIEALKEDGFFNVIKSECNGKIIAAYYDFVIAFHNEHNYCGPVISTELLRKLLVNLADEINKELNR